VAFQANLGMLTAAQHWLGRLHDPAQWLALVLLLEFAVQPLSTLVHELGHAIAVAAVGKCPAHAIVGRGPWLTAQIGRFMVSFSPFPMRGVLVRGICRYDPAGISWRSRGWIALAAAHLQREMNLGNRFGELMIGDQVDITVRVLLGPVQDRAHRQAS